MADEAKNAELAAFVNAIARQAGYTTHADWSRDSGFPATNLSEVRSGSAGIDGANLVRLIRAAARRLGSTSEELALGVAEAERAAAVAEIVRAVDRHVDDRLQELAGMMDEGFARLAAGIVREELRSSGADAPSASGDAQ